MAVSSPRRVRSAGLAALLLVLPASVGAQAPMMHGMTQGPPALEERVGRADAAALATVDSVADDRIRFRDAVAVFGSVPAAFEVKRRPAAPLALAAGERTLLLLAGARSPYVVVDDPKDVPSLPDAGSARRRADAVRQVHASREDVESLRAVYLQLTEGEDEALRGEALRSLLRFGGPFLPIPPAVAHARAEVALDEGRSLPVRQAAAALAANDPEALDLLLSRIAGGGFAGDPALTAAILRSGLLRTRPAATRALRVALEDDDAGLRLAAVDLVNLAPSEAVETRLSELAASDPDPRIRELAAHRLARVRGKDAGGR